MFNVLVINCGSSSLKYQLMEMDTESLLAKGLIERIGLAQGIHTFSPAGAAAVTEELPIPDHARACELLLAALLHAEHGVIRSLDEIGAIGHRVVHAGERYSASVLIDEDVLDALRACVPLAPLHNPPNLRGYEAAKRILPDVPHALVFDTAYHQTMPPTSFLYGLPYVLYTRHRIRRYGFHGTSHRFVGWRSRHLLGKPREQTRLVTCHLGNGASLCAIDHGKSIDTSMGFTPLEGLLMGTRSGDLDASVVFHVMHEEDLTEHQVTTMLNKHSGLFGLSGVSNDMRELLAEEAKGHERSKLAIDLFCYRLRKYVAAYAGAMGGVDAVIFTGGIGENSPEIRARSLAGLEFMGIRVDAVKNLAAIGKEADISAEGATVRTLVIPTNEELIIARDTVRLVEGAEDS